MMHIEAKSVQFIDYILWRLLLALSTGKSPIYICIPLRC